jgi:hypothetical protein
MCVSHRRCQLMLLENQWTAVSQGASWKTCKKGEDDRTWHRFGAGLGGSDAFVSRGFPEKRRESNREF